MTNPGDPGREPADPLRRVHEMQAIARLTGRIAHEFNNLFTEMQGHLARLGEALPEADPAHADLDAARGALARAAGLTRQLLAYTRQQVLEPQLVDLARVVRDLEQTLRSVVPRYVELVVVPGAHRVVVRVDANQIEQVILNLVTNACDAIEADGVLSIEVGEATIEPDAARAYSYPVVPGRYALLVVGDTGHGIDPHVTARLFEPFFSTRARRDRVGLGLSSVYGIVKQSGGYVWVDSAAGVGTTVSVYLPLVTEAEAERERGAAAAALPRTHPARPATVLVVEDNPAVRAMVLKATLRAGHVVLEAADGAEALRVAERYDLPIDVLVTDVMMPHLDGPQLAQRLRAGRPQLRVLYMSGFAHQSAMRPDHFDPHGEFIQKPFTPEEFVAKLRATLG